MRAVIYTRVSTKEQSQEGYSLAAQRDACAEWIASHDGEVVAEFCDAGESARTADRPEFKRLLDTLRDDRTIDILAVHKLDRLARNLEDHAAIRAALRKLDVQLVSITENFERTPSGQLIEGIIASLSEFYSGNLALEIRKGQQQKLKSGWWPAKAPIGYRNIRTEGERREARIEVHPEHGPLVREAFELYATGSWPLTALQAHLTERGLHPRSGQLSRARLAVTLANPFYIGIMCWQGVDYPGKHEALVTPDLFDRVQAVLAVKGHQGRQRRNDHPMRGLLHCGECGSRLCFTVAKGRFEYFFCLGRQRDTASCNQPHSPSELVEELVETVERRAVLPPDLRPALDRALDREVDTRVTATGESSRNARRELDRLSTRRSRLLDAYLGGAVNLSEFQAEQAVIRAAIRSAEQRLHRNEARLREGRRRIDEALDDLKPRNSHRTHVARRQRIFETIHVAAGEVTAVTYRQPYALLLGGSSNDALVDLLGRYSNPDNVARLHRILTGQGRDRPSHRPVPSLHQMQTRLAQEQVSELITMHERGVPIDELAATFRIHRATVMAHLDRAGAERRTGLIQRRLNEAHGLYESGSSLARVAEHFGVDAETVRRAFKNAGIPLRPRRGWQY